MLSTKCIDFVYDTRDGFKYLYISQADAFARYVKQYFPKENLDDIRTFIELNVFDEEAI